VRLLVASPFVPYPLDFGGAIRIYHLLRHLATRHEVVLLCPEPIDRTAADALSFCTAVESFPAPASRPWHEHARHLAGRLPASVSLTSEALATRAHALLRGARFDIVQVEFLGLAHLREALPAGLPTVLVEHCLATEARTRQLGLMPWGPRRLYYALDLLKLRRYEPAAIRSFDACVTVSSRDAEQVRTWAPQVRTTTIPNGVDTEFFQAAGDTGEAEMLFLGSFHLDAANVDAAVQMACEILPRVRRHVPDARLTIVGTAPPAAVTRLGGLPGVTVAGGVPDVRPYLARAAIVALPLRAGAGTKVRVFTAMAMQRAVLATRLAAEGLDAAPGEEIVIAHDTARFVEEAVMLLRDAPRRARIGRAARARVVRDYDWRVLARRLETFHEALLDRPAARAALTEAGKMTSTRKPKEHSACAESADS